LFRNPIAREKYNIIFLTTWSLPSRSVRRYLDSRHYVRTPSDKIKKKTVDVLMIIIIIVKKVDNRSPKWNEIWSSVFVVCRPGVRRLVLTLACVSFKTFWRFRSGRSLRRRTYGSRELLRTWRDGQPWQESRRLRQRNRSEYNVFWHNHVYPWLYRGRYVRGVVRMWQLSNATLAATVTQTQQLLELRKGVSPIRSTRFRFFRSFYGLL